MALLTYYNDKNMNILQGKTQRITCGVPTDPMITYEVKQGETPNVKVSTWYEVICHSTASFEYVGMDYATADKCRTAMITKFTRTKTLWEFDSGSYDKETNTFFAGWKQKTNGAIVQEAEVSLQPMGGHMYKVTVNVDCEDISYTTDPTSASFPYPSCMSDLK